MTGKEKHKVSASIQIEDGKYVVRGRVYDPVTGKIRHRSKATGFKVKGNRRRAEEKMKQIVSDWQREANSEVVCADPLFSESVALWLDNKSATLRESTITAYKYNINGHILPHFGNMRTREITRHQIRVFYSELLKKLSPQTVKKIHIIVLGAMEEAVEDGIISDNPAAKIKLPKSKKYVGFAYTEEQVSKLLDDIRADEEPMRSAITLALVYGLRRSEICGLRWKDIDFDKNIMHICNTVVENAGQIWETESTKTIKSNRILDLGSVFVPYLKELRESQLAAGVKLDKVCCFPNGKAVRPRYLSEKLSPALKKHGVDPHRLHDLRHTAASLMAKRATLNQVRDFLGHEDISTTYGIYVHSDMSDKRACSKIMDDVFQRAEKCTEDCTESA